MRKKDADSVLSLRLPANEAARLQREARSRGMTVSRLAREALARGLAEASRNSLSYGVASGAPLSIVTAGIGLPETRTVGVLALEVV